MNEVDERVFNELKEAWKDRDLTADEETKFLELEQEKFEEAFNEFGDNEFIGLDKPAREYGDLKFSTFHVNVAKRVFEQHWSSLSQFEYTGSKGFEFTLDVLKWGFDAEMEFMEEILNVAENEVPTYASIGIVPRSTSIERRQR